MWRASWGYLVFYYFMTRFSHVGSAAGFETFNDNSIEDYDYNYEDLLNYFLIFPGTKWCGKGSVANDDNDLGSNPETDACCRAHDKCDAIEGGQSKYGLTNHAPYTRLHCDCDQTFLNCLRNSKDGKASQVVGTLYFDLLNTKCFKEEHKVTGCKQFNSLGTRCKEYAVDSSSQKTYQWFDVPMFNDK